MRRFWISALCAIAFAFLLPASAVGQTQTTVTGTVAGSDSVPWAGARLVARLNSPGGLSPTLTPCTGPAAQVGCQFQNPGPVTLNANGAFSIPLWANASILPAGTTYTLSVSSAGSPPPLGTGPQTCTVAAVTIAGASQIVTFTGCPALSNIVSSSTSPTSVSPAFVAGATADYRPVNQTSGTVLTDVSGNGNNVTFATSATCPANPSFNSTGGLQFSALSSQCIALPASLNNLAVELVLNSGDPGANNFGNNPITGGYDCALGGSAATNTLELCLGGFSGVGAGRFVTGLLSQPVGGSGTLSEGTDALIGTHFVAYVPGTPDAFYIDGQLLTNWQAFVAGSTVGQITSGTWQLGGSNAWTAGSFFNGRIDMARFLPVASATAKNIQQDYLAAQALEAAGGVVLGNPAGLGNQGLNLAAPSTCVSVFAGDSITWGTGIAIPMSNALFIYGPNCDIRNGGYPNLRAQGINGDMFSTCGPYYRPLAGLNFCHIWSGTNDLNTGSGVTAQQVFASVLQGCRQARLLGFKTFAGTLLSNGNNSDFVRDQFNTMLRNGAVPTCDDLIDYAANATLGADGSNTGAGFQADHVHPTQASATQIMAPMASAHINFLQANLTTNGSGSPHVFKSGAATIPQIVQWNQTNTVNCSGASSATPACSFNIPVSPGSTVCVYVISYTTADTITSAADTLGGTFTAISAGGLIGGALPFRGLCAPNSTGGTDTITTTLAGAATTSTTIFEIYGAASAAPIDATSTVNNATSTTPNTSAVTTTVANDLLIGVGGLNNSYSYFSAPGSQYAMNSNWIPTTNGEMALESQLGPIVGSYSGINATGAGFGVSASVNWAMQLFAVKPGTYGATIQMLPSDCSPINPPRVDPSGGAFTLQLPDAVVMAGETCKLNNIATSPSANAVTLAAINSQTINGAANLPLQFNAVTTCTAVLVSASAAGANWSCTNPGAQTIALTTNYTNSTTTFSNVTGSNNLAFQVAPGTTYHIDCTLYYQAAATGGLNIEFTGPAAPAQVDYSLNAPIAAGTTNAAVATTYGTSLGAVVTTPTTNFPATVSFDLVNGTSGGAVQLLAKSSAAVQLEIVAGSSCKMIQ